jgi:hypothetical protein
MDRRMIYYEVVRNNCNRTKLKYLENDLSQCHFFHHKSHMDCPGIVKLGLCGKRLEFNQWSNDMVVNLSGIGIAGININFLIIIIN